MKKLLAITLVCVLLLAVTPLALAQTVAPGGEVTVEVPFSGAALNLLHAQYTVSSGLTVKSGTVAGMQGKAGKSMALFVNIPAVTSGTLKLVVAAGSGASGDQTIQITTLRGYTPSKWTDLTGKKTITIKVQPASGGMPGDANNDGKVDHMDLTAIVLYVLDGKALGSKANADANGDGSIDHQDLTAIVLFVLDGKPMR